MILDRNERRRLHCSQASSLNIRLLMACLLCVDVACSDNAGLWAPDDASVSANPSSMTLPESEERICVSLRAIERLVHEAASGSTSPPEALHNLWGLNYLEGFIVDGSGGRDLILVGRRPKDTATDPKRPAIRLDDLIVNLRDLADSGQYPYCSLDPRPQDVQVLSRRLQELADATSPEEIKAMFSKLKSSVGPQTVVVGGVPRDSRHAHIMIDADYHMKQASQGHILLDGVISYLDRALAEARQDMLAGRPANTGSNMARFWFHLAKRGPTFLQDKGIVWIDSCPVVVLTEKQAATPSGDLHDVEEDDPVAEAFASDLSRDFARLTVSVPVYADIENLFRLRALLLAAQFRDAFTKAGLDLKRYCQNYLYHDESPMPPDLPGIANLMEWTHITSDGLSQTKHYICPMVFGGVGMDMAVNESTVRGRRSEQLTSLRTSALGARPSKDSIQWLVPSAAPNMAGAAGQESHGSR